MSGPDNLKLPINYSKMPPLERVNALNGNNQLTANKPLNAKNPLSANNALNANNELAAKMIYETQRLKYDWAYGTTIFAAGKNSINTIYTGHRIYTQLTLACANLEFDLIEKIIALGADVNLSPLNYYLDNRDEAYEKDKGLAVFHNTPLYELINSMINKYSTSKIPVIEKSFINTIKLFISKNAKFTYNIPYSLINNGKYGGTINFDDKENSFDFYTKDLKIPLAFLPYLKTNILMGGTIVSSRIYKLIWQAFTEYSSENKGMLNATKEQFVEGDLTLLGEPLSSTFLDIEGYRLFRKYSLKNVKGGSRSRKNRNKRNARRSKSLTRRV